MALYILELLYQKNGKMQQKGDLQQNTVCLNQQIYPSPENFAQPFVVMVGTFRMYVLGKR